MLPLTYMAEYMPFLYATYMFVPYGQILANLVLKCLWRFTLAVGVKLLLIMQIMTSSEVKRSRANQ